MPELTVNDKPRITDTVRFTLMTPDGDGCYDTSPYKVDRVVIYYVERNFLGNNFGEVDEVIQDQATLERLTAAEELACSSPTEENLTNVQRLKEELESKSQRNTIYFKEAKTVYALGTELAPAWFSASPDDSILEEVETGEFEFVWSPQDSAAREGNYFICWTWTPLLSGETLSAHIPFAIHGDTRAVTALPTHHTPEQKYEILLERYLPEMYKTFLCDGDLTPATIDQFNKSVADGFTFVEDYANQLIDLLDANVLHESLLSFLGNLFNLRLRSNDPTLWRRQIKEAIPVFKKKGTEDGLKDAFAQSGMSLDKVTRYYQLISKYTHMESFKVSDSPTFVLYRQSIETVNETNFALWLRREGTEAYVSIGLENVEFAFDEETCEVSMTWIGDEKSAGAIELYEGDILRVLYQFKEVPNATEQQLEDYFRTLDFMDTRDEADQDYPPKNWNVRLIEVDDPLFDILVPVRHPFHDPLIFGQIRTEFPYSENIYNMEEYNGSIRDSYDACFIDKEFLDPCGACASSKFSVDLTIEELSNNRLLEVRDILNEYKPFHSVVHNINFSGEVEEIVPSPVETIETLVTVSHTDYTLPGNANSVFHRVMEDGLTISRVEYEDFADDQTVASGTATAYNEQVSLIAINVDLEDLGIIEGASSILEVLSPSANAGTYNLVNVEGQTARVSSTVLEPINTNMFTFNLKNALFGTGSATITQRDLFRFTDSSVDYIALNVKSQWDVANDGDYSGGPWKVEIPAYGSTYEIIEVLPNGILVLEDDGTLPTSDVTGVTYNLLNDSDVEQDNSTTGSLEVRRQGLVDLNNASLTPSNIEEIMNRGDWVFYDGAEYLIVSLDGVDLVIDGYSGGDVAGANVQVRRLLAENRLGHFGYSGLRLITDVDQESAQSMVNGINAPSGDFGDDSHFKENYLFKINGEYYRIEFIDGDKVILGGPDVDWTTLSSGGTSVSYELIWLEKDGVEVKFWVFDHLDRDGQDIVERRIESTVDDNVAVVALSTPGGGSSIQEAINQEESVSFQIEYKDGNKSDELEFRRDND